MRWLKTLFQKKKTLEEVKTWLSEEQQKQQTEQQQATDEVQKQFPELLDNVRNSIKELETAELRNPNIPERAKHYMTGNREQFLKLTSRFLDNLFVPREAADFSQIELLFHQYAQNTARPTAILAEFFGEEVKNIRSALAEAENKIQELKKFQLKKDELKKIENMIKKIEDIKEEQKRIEKQRGEFEEQLQQLKNKREAIRKEKEEFNSRPEYKQVKEDLLSTTRERQEAEQAITSLFLSLSDPIKKYAHKTKNEKLAKYAENPVDALIHDYSLGILKHGQAIGAALEKGELDLKPEKIQKAQDALKQLTKENLSAMIHRYAKAKKQEADMQSDVAQRPIMKEYEQYAVDLRTLGADIEQMEKTIAKLATPTDEDIRELLKHELENYGIALT